MDESIVGVDYLNRSILINVSISDFYGPNDLFYRVSRSPKKHNKSNDSEEGTFDQNHHPVGLHKQMTLEVHQVDTVINTNSRSSSCSSLDNLSQNDGISFITIIEYTPHNKLESTQIPLQIWLGTTYGSVIVLNLVNMTSCTENKQVGNQKSAMITPTGVVHSLKGSIVHISYLDLNPNLAANCIATPTVDTTEELDIDFSYLNMNQVSNSIADNFHASSYSKDNTSNSDNNSNSGGTNSSPSPTLTPTISSFVSPFSNALSQSPVLTSQQTVVLEDPPKSSKMLKKSLIGTKSSKGEFGITQEIVDHNQFAILVSEYQIKVVSLPSNTCTYKNQILDGIVSKASVQTINCIPYLTCFLSNGAFLIYYLPNPTLKVNLNLNSNTYLVKEKDLLDHSIRTFVFGAKGHSLFMCSPSEIQKLYLSTPIGSSCLTDMLAEFFDPKIICPAPPKPNIFKSLFSTSPVDREELFGENSGKPSSCIVKNMDGEVQKTRNQLTELQKLALERGEKLSQLEQKSEQMTQAASAFAKNASDLANKYKSKRFF